MQITPITQRSVLYKSSAQLTEGAVSNLLRTTRLHHHEGRFVVVLQLLWQLKAHQ